jgi:hypothetical protein
MRLGGRTLACLLVPGLLLVAALHARLAARGRRRDRRLQAEDSVPPASVSVDSVSVERGGGEAVGTPRQPELHELEERYRARRELTAAACLEHRPELEARYRALWPELGWEQVLARADVLEKRDRGMLWCKVPKAASESWTRLFVQQWYGRKSRQLMWRQQVLLHGAWAPRRRSAAYIRAIARTHFSFLTTRHPFERLLSAYRDKFFPNGPAKYSPPCLPALHTPSITL